jgi:hypothetical protein
VNILSTFCTGGAIGEAHVDVVWTNGLNIQGRIRVVVPPALHDRDVIAELAALHHLLVVRAIFGDDRAGNSLILNVSAGAIKKLVAQRSAKQHLVSFANFLAVRFADADIEVKTKLTWLRPRAENNVEEIVVTEGALDDELELRPLGRVTHTRHALEQFAIRSNRPDAYSDAWRSIRIVLSNRLEERIASEETQLARLERHGIEGRVFHHPGSRWSFVVTEAEGEPRRIVTAYHDSGRR